MSSTYKNSPKFFFFCCNNGYIQRKEKLLRLLAILGETWACCFPFWFLDRFWFPWTLYFLPTLALWALVGVVLGFLSGWKTTGPGDPLVSPVGVEAATVLRLFPLPPLPWATLAWPSFADTDSNWHSTDDTDIEEVPLELSSELELTFLKFPFVFVTVSFGSAQCLLKSFVWCLCCLLCLVPFSSCLLPILSGSRLSLFLGPLLAEIFLLLSFFLL